MFTFDVPRHIPTWAGLCYGQVRAESYREVRSNRAVARIISTEVQEISRPGGMRARVGFLVRGSEPHHRQLRGMGERCKHGTGG